MNREELIEYLTDYQSRLISFNANFVRNYEKAGRTYAPNNKHGMMIMEIKEVNERLNKAIQAEDVTVQVVTMKSRIK